MLDTVNFMSDFLREALRSREKILALQPYKPILKNVKNMLEDLLDLFEALEEAERRKASGEEKIVVRTRTGTRVVKYVTCGKKCNGCPHGPYIYRVYKVNKKQVWEYLGRAA